MLNVILLGISTETFCQEHCPPSGKRSRSCGSCMSSFFDSPFQWSLHFPGFWVWILWVELFQRGGPKWSQLRNCEVLFRFCFRVLISFFSYQVARWESTYWDSSTRVVILDIRYENVCWISSIRGSGLSSYRLETWMTTFSPGHCLWSGRQCKAYNDCQPSFSLLLSFWSLIALISQASSRKSVDWVTSNWMVHLEHAVLDVISCLPPIEAHH